MSRRNSLQATFWLLGMTKLLVGHDSQFLYDCTQSNNDDGLHNKNFRSKLPALLGHTFWEQMLSLHGLFLILETAFSTASVSSLVGWLWSSRTKTESPSEVAFAWHLLLCLEHLQNISPLLPSRIFRYFWPSKCSAIPPR